MTGANRMFVGEIAGRWWLPRRKTYAITGTLRSAWNERPRVSGVGLLQRASTEALVQHLQPRQVQHQLVYGHVADGRDVTLADVRVALRQAHLDSPKDSSVELTAWRAYLGAHLKSEAVAFGVIDLELDYLLDFIDRPFIPEETRFADGRILAVALAMEPDEPTLVRFPGGTLSMGLDQKVEGDRSHQRTISRRARATLTLEAPLNPIEWVTTYVASMRDLLSLVTGRAISVGSAILRESSDRRADREVDFIWNRDPPAARTDEFLLPDERLFTAASTPIPLMDLIGRWFGAAVDLRPLLDLFFATRSSRQLVEEHRLLNLTQSLEAFHRIRIGGHPVDPDEHDQRFRRVLACVERRDHRWTSYALKRANEFNLAERISALVAAHPWLLGDLVKSTANKFGDQVALTRNYHTHWDTIRGKGASTGAELWPLNEQLTVLMEVCLLAELGFDDEAASEAIRRASRSYRALKLNGL